MNKERREEETEIIEKRERRFRDRDFDTDGMVGSSI
jgi:hypothetical protein